MLGRVLDLEFDLKHFRMSRDEVTCEERDALKILEHERGAWEREEWKAREDARETERMMQGAQHGRR